MFRRFLLLLPAVCLLTPHPAQAQAPTPLLPDLVIQSKTPFTAYDNNGVRRLYFSSWSMNNGPGPIDLRGATVHGDLQDVDQRVYNTDGTYTDHRVGTFEYHPTHGHIHFQGYARYSLREVLANDGVGGVLGTSEKVSFCLLDVRKSDPPPPGTPATAQYRDCETFQGISVGWIDVYDYTLPDQNIVITGVSAGTYWLELEVDFEGRLLETNNDNNIHRTKFTISGGFAPEIDVRGNAISIPHNDATPGSADGTDFGVVSIAQGQVTRTFTIANTGTGSLTLPAVPKVTLAGSGDFSVTAQPGSPVAANGSTTFQITFDPSAVGTRTATVTILNNDANEGSYQFVIRGNLDSDNDGLPDAWETTHSVTDPAGDPDDDGEDNLSEFYNGTLPHDSSSVVHSGKALNISTRLPVETGDSVAIGGFIVTGPTAKVVMIRALGPSLGAFVASPLQDPVLELHNASGLLASNDDWRSTNEAAITASGLAPGHDVEAALLRQVEPGNYTAIVKGKNATSGIALLEIYDTEMGTSSLLANISTRGHARTGDEVIIGGLIVGQGHGVDGSGRAAVVVRALGPTLAGFGLSDTLSDPTLEVRNADGGLVGFNDDWQNPDPAPVNETGLAPGDARESALRLLLPRGHYTAILRGRDSTTGLGLIEVYRLP